MLDMMPFLEPCLLLSEIVPVGLVGESAPANGMLVSLRTHHLLDWAYKYLLPIWIPFSTGALSGEALC